MPVALCALTTTLATFGFALTPRLGLAQPARDVALSVQATPEGACIDAERLRALVESRIGSSVFSDAENARRFIDVQFHVANDVFSATLVVRDAAGRTLGDREISTQSTTCDSLDPLLVLVISTSIGPVELPPTAAKEPARPAHRRAQQTRAPDPDEAEALGTHGISLALDTNPAALSAPVRFALGLSAQAVSGLLPGIAPSVTVDLLVRYESLELRAKVGATPHIQTDLGGGAQADFLAILGEAQACGIATERTGGPLSFCAGASVGGLSAQTRGLLQNARTLHPVVLLVFSATLQVSIQRQQALLLGGGVNLPLLAPRYYYWESPNERRDLHTVELGAFAEFGWLWRFSS
jgi:hypothetical protein